MKFLNALLPALFAPVVLGGFLDASSTSDKALKVPGDNPMYHCENPEENVLQLESVDLAPNPPQPGKTLTITATGTLLETIKQGAQAHLQVKYGLITIVRQTADLCDLVQNVNLHCPIEQGKLTLVKEVNLPKAIPPGMYTVSADVYTKEEDKITCLKAVQGFNKLGVEKHEGL